jgi:hypothetical protein
MTGGVVVLRRWRPPVPAARNHPDAGITSVHHKGNLAMDAIFTAFSLFLVLLVILGIAAIELGADTRPGFDRSSLDR